MEFGLYQQQTTKLMMTTSLRQAITLLQYNSQELMDFLYEKSLENPLIDVKERSQQGKAFQFEQYSKVDTSLAHHLHTQLGERKIPPALYKTLIFLIDNLTTAGYLEEDDEELSFLTHVSIDEIRIAKKILQSFEPVGVGAKDAKEALLLQIRKKGESTLLIERILEEQFEALLRKSYRRMSQALKVPEEEVKKSCHIILQYNPRPGAEFEQDPSIYIAPELLIRNESGKFVVKVIGSNLPAISLCPLYEQWKKEGNQEEDKYLQEKLQEYQWLKHSLSYRQQTLLAVADVIVKEQHQFLIKGPRYLRPMTLGYLADLLNVHESTVSRAVRNKYIQTPFGVYELKYFFSGKVESDSGDCISNKTVKDLIKELIQEENRQKPYSDQTLSTILQEQYGLHVARRTVTKYREEQFIPSSQQRKQV